NMKTIYQDQDLLVIDKPAGISVNDLEKQLPETGLLRNGIIHRLDKDTSGLLLVAKTSKSLLFFQNQFKNREIEKTYIALVFGKMEEDSGICKTLIGRDNSGVKQKVYLLTSPKSKKTGPRTAETEWKVIKRYKEYTLVEAKPKTGRKHQIRVHLAYLGHPIVGDKLYSFKNQKIPDGLERQFLHAKSLKLKMLKGEKKEFQSELPINLKNILCQIQ
ncbi:RluA family pseudouridine synthase, partial [Patescibacteria group bacterium]|nr:RluA family pseudouridine synthase [Patescibacteria group bacterium]